MNLIDSLQMAWKTLTVNKLRSGLTMLGIVIGNSSVIALVGIGQGVQSYSLTQLESYGSNLLSVLASLEGEGGLGEEISLLTLTDAEAIATQAPDVQEVAPQISMQAVVAYSTQHTSTTLTGTTPGFLYVRNATVASGRFLSESEQRQSAPVIVLGAVPARRLFGSLNPVGQEVRVENATFRVIGVLQPKGSRAGVNQDDAAYIPITTMVSQLSGQQSPYGIPIDLIEISAKDKQRIASAVFQVTNILTRRHGKQDFSIQSDQAFEAIIGQVTGSLSLMLVAIASISLVVGGIGIMNIMLVSVAERTQEIGLRKAVGATSRDVLVQFLIEAVILSLMGGGIGTGIGVGIVFLIAGFTPLGPAVSWVAITLAMGVSGGIGLIFGVLPAHQAARLDPITALRRA
jgi:putative ABC transport system permease protein